jgi:tetratricopeptide (TPR) repeat protein
MQARRGMAIVLKRRGDEAMDSLQYDEAIADYSKAYAISKDPVFLYNRGRVYQARDRYPEALAAC